MWMSGFARLPALLLLGLAAAAAMAIGSFGPWATTGHVEFDVTISGTDLSQSLNGYSPNGWLVLLAAATGAGALILHARGNGLGAIGALLAGLCGAAVTISDRLKITNTASKDTAEVIGLQVGWGLHLAAGASIALGVVGLVAATRVRTACPACGTTLGLRWALRPAESDDDFGNAPAKRCDDCNAILLFSYSIWAVILSVPMALAAISICIVAGDALVSLGWMAVGVALVLIGALLRAVYGRVSAIAAVVNPTGTIIGHLGALVVIFYALQVARIEAVSAERV